jgi:hypothetical protein
MAHSTCDLMAVLANFGLGRRRGGSYACPGAASRVVVLVVPGRRPYTRSRVRLTEDLELYSGRRGGVPSAQALTVVGAREDGVPSAVSGMGRRTRNGRGSKIGSGKGNSRARGGGGSPGRWCAAGGQRNGEKNEEWLREQNRIGEGEFERGWELGQMVCRRWSAEWGEERPTDRIVDGRSGTGRQQLLAWARVWI